MPVSITAYDQEPGLPYKCRDEYNTNVGTNDGMTECDSRAIAKPLRTHRFHIWTNDLIRFH
jgi:hypothetical protein